MSITTQHKNKLKETIIELLHNKKINSKHSQLLLKQTSNLIIKENLVLQLKQELIHHQRLNFLLKDYYEVCKKRKHLTHFNYNEAVTGCSQFKIDCKELIKIVETYDSTLEKLKKDKYIIIKQSEDILKLKIDSQYKFNRRLIDLQQQVKKQEKEMKDIINKKESLIMRKHKENEEYENIIKTEEEKYNTLKEKINILNEKSIRYYKTYEHFLDPGFLLNDESFAKDLLHKENKEM